METPTRPAVELQSGMVKSQPGDTNNENGNSKTSERQREANRQNALRSTGPRTAAGKEHVRWNAVTHGLLAQEILLPGEDAEAFEDLARRMRTEAQPLGVEEDALVERMIACWWRLRRLTRVETGILASEYFGILEGRASREALSHTGRNDDNVSKAIDGMYALSREHKRQQALARQALATGQEIARRAEADTPTLGQAFVRGVSGADALSKLSRYEASIERSYYRALHELQRRQLARQGEDVPAPLAVDVTVTGEADASS
jgi:hypothetical protein